VLVPVDGLPEVVDLAGSEGILFIRSLRALIGAKRVEPIRITDRWEFWVDEDGWAAGKPVNQAATRVAGAFGARFSLRGTVVITGADDDDGGAGSAALSRGQADAIFRRVTALP
jgi:hypothetical protein